MSGYKGVLRRNKCGRALSLCAIDKDPGPDGITMNFIQTFWALVKEDIMGILHYFHEHHVFKKIFNANFVALIRKKEGTVESRDFRPISVISGVYKIYAKVLAERTKRVINRLVNKHQMAFVKGRQITDAALIANDTVLIREPKVEQVFIRVLLVVFEVVSGLRVNWRKSSIYPVKEVSSIQTFGSILGCGMGYLPIVYLGMPLGRRHKDVEIQNNILTKAEKGLAQ
ncbi:hypothetical protein MTR67_035616 [Solanum verrucosum]|uniref:Reverse transcriptase domain-containing protein n=1 Tax=Solanum verrucosum TaxID=315347 RepID=A0AAF0UAP8_SOLVR|nr:hypothetical protein MTR67_035616 [Solanum verrucosum]